VCEICSKLIEYLDELKEEGAFRYQKSEPEFGDLLGKYYDVDLGKWVTHLDMLELCPQCEGNDIFTVSKNFEATKHQHKCNGCGFNSGVVDGRAF